MTTPLNILVVIPARGGSKGIPRKNLRLLNGKPLIYYSIKAAINSKFALDTYVSTDDKEIAAIAEKLGAKTVVRDSSKAQDNTTLDPVIYDCYQQVSKLAGKEYELIVTLQPTSPLLTTLSLDSAIERIITHREIDTIISAKNDTHLTWKRTGGRYVPNYEKRLNRQYLEPVFRETGGFLITRSSVISDSNRIGQLVDLYVLKDGESVDIDSFDDWSLCAFYLKRKRILFVVSGYPEIGLGHVYNTLVLANDILDHQVEFLVDFKSELALKLISSKNYTVHMQSEREISEDIRKLKPDVVINDCLDTSYDYMNALKEAGFKVINFEDLGIGAKAADLVINAIYPEKYVFPNHYFGHDYFVLRDEFLLTERRRLSENVTNVLLTFGGVDPSNLTFKVVKSIYKFCKDVGITISIVAGFGYSSYESLSEFDGLKIYKNSSNISDHMANADIIFTSAGRTTYEVASLQVPCIVLAQNERELTHFFASPEFGFVNLGLGLSVSNVEILQSFVGIVESRNSRAHMVKLMSKANLRSGRARVLRLIKDIVEAE